MDSRFSDNARKILRIAHDIAAEMGYNYVGTEHILAGILRDGSSGAASAMQHPSADNYTLKSVSVLLNRYIYAVLDDHGVRSLVDFACLVPLHLSTCYAAECEVSGEDLDQSFAEILV